jgi:hypothetical protein
VQVIDVDYSSSVAKYNQYGTIEIEAVNGSNLYEGNTVITFPETFPTLNVVDYLYTGNGKTFIAPEDGNYILEA